MVHIRVDPPITNNKWVGFGLANVDTICTLTRHEHDPLTRIVTPNHTSLGQCIYLIVYVDDIVITGSDQDGIRKLKQHLFNHSQTKTWEKSSTFWGLR